jgi:exodeoxyribonuclease VII small subunit
MSDSQTAPDFEAAYRELGEIVNQLESGELTLEQSVGLYERGRQLIALCERLLDNAEQRVTRLSGDTETGINAEPLA